MSKIIDHGFPADRIALPTIARLQQGSASSNFDRLVESPVLAGTTDFLLNYLSRLYVTVVL